MPRIRWNRTDARKKHAFVEPTAYTDPRRRLSRPYLEHKET